MNIITESIKQSTWTELKTAAQAGELSCILKSGDLIPFTLKNGEEVAVRATRDDSEKWFFILEDCLADMHRMNKRATNKGGWAECEMRRYLNNTVFALLPDELQEVIAPTRIVQVLDGERVETEDKLFLLSKTQMFGKGYWSEQEPEDTQLVCFRYEKDRVKECGDNGTWYWWLRSPEAPSSSSFCAVYASGGTYTYTASLSHGVAFGFCLI